MPQRPRRLARPMFLAVPACAVALAMPASVTAAAAPRFAAGNVLGELGHVTCFAAVPDITGDGIPDLVIASSFGVTIEQGGSGGYSFYNGTVVTGLNRATGLAVGDVNGDGLADVVLAGDVDQPSPPHSALELLSAQPGGFFAAPVQVATFSQHTTGTVLGDFDHDGHLDVAVALDDRVAVFRGLAGGGFGAESDVLTGTSPRQLATGDLNGDATADLVVATGAGVDVLLGHPGTGLGTPVAYSSTITPAGLALGDVTGDGHTDVVVAGTGATTAVETYAGHGDGTLTAAVVSSAGSGAVAPSALALGDLNGDGRLDAALTVGGNVVSALGAGTGTFSAARTAPAAADLAGASLAVVDADRDGHADVVYGLGAYGLAWLLGRGDGTLRAPTAAAPLGGVTAMAGADFNGDGRPDLAVVSGSTATIELGNGDGTFTVAGSATLSGAAVQVVAADLTGDGRPDLAVTEVDSATVTDSLAILPVGAAGTLGAPVASYTLLGAPQGLAAGDVDGDGHADLAVLAAGTVQLFLGGGDGTFSMATVPPPQGPPGATPAAIALADMEGLGRADLVVAAQEPEFQAAVEVYHSTGLRAAPLAPPVSTPLADFNDTVTGLAVGDVDGNGHPGAVVIGIALITVAHGTGTPVLLPGGGFDNAYLNSGVLTADLTGSGRADIVVVSGPEAVLQVWDTSGQLNLVAGGTYDTAGRAAATAVLDANGDGRPDVVAALPSGLVTLLQY